MLASAGGCAALQAAASATGRALPASCQLAAPLSCRGVHSDHDATVGRAHCSAPPAATARPPSCRRRAAPLCRARPRDSREVESCVPEDDPRYRRTDFSSQHAYEARHSFLRCLAAGEAAINLAAAALHVAAEDDALVSHSSVQLPVSSYQQRLQRMASELAGQYLPGGSGGGTAGTAEGASQQAVLDAILRYLFEVKGFRVPSYGRTNLPGQAILAHPGVWERASHAYLNEVLTRKQGIPAVLAIILEDLVRRLLVMGAIDFAIRVECRNLGALPKATVLPLPREAVVRPDGTVLNTCTTESLAEMLSFLKRCFWPFAWDSNALGGGGGFAGAARVFLEGESDASMQAISRTARHRLERGIWTSPGAGDIRRALAACQRLVLLRGEEVPWERRDLAVLLMHVGRFREAKAELLRFLQAAPAAPPGGEAGLQPLTLTLGGAVLAVGGQTWEERELVDRLLGLLSGVEPAEGGPLTLESALREPPPAAQAADDSRLPLTW